MTSQPLLDFERAMYCERDKPDCGACSLVMDGRDCAGVDVDPARQRQPTRDAEIARLVWRGRHERNCRRAVEAGR